MLDDIASIAPAFLDPDVGGEAGLPPLTEPELRAFMLRDLPAMQESGFLTLFVIIEGSGTIAGGIICTTTTSSEAGSRSATGCSRRARPRHRHARQSARSPTTCTATASCGSEAVVRPENERSIRVLERLGFTREGRLRQLLRYRDGRADAFIYSLLPGE